MESFSQFNAYAYLLNTLRDKTVNKAARSTLNSNGGIFCSVQKSGTQSFGRKKRIARNIGKGEKTEISFPKTTSRPLSTMLSPANLSNINMVKTRRPTAPM